MKKIFILFTLLSLAFGWLPPHNALAQQAPEALPAFGYTWETGLAFGDHWVDIESSGTPVEFSSTDDGITYIALPIGFDFKYFENTYTSLYASTNGFLSLDTIINSFPENQPIPRDYLPNNIIAPFWDDLTIWDAVTNPEGAVYYQLMGSAPNRSLVVEFYHVTRFGALAGELLTFEVILHENGNIVFAYKELNGELGSATVGFEDDAGVDGLQHLYNQVGLANQQAMRAVYPADGSRLKAFPRYASGFAQNYEVVLPFTLRNTGTLTEGYVFNCTRLSGDPTNLWIPSFETSAGQPIGSITSLAPGQDYPMQVRLKAPASAVPGDYYRARIRVTASSTQYFDIYVQGAVAAPFAQSFIDDGDGYVQFITPTVNVTRKIFETFTGATINLLHVLDMDYLLAWEVSESQPQQYINIETVPFRATNTAVLDPQPLQDHVNDPESVSDGYPSMVQLPGGQNGAAFLRSRQSGLTYQTNVFFGLLDSRGQLSADPVNLTQNEDWQPINRYRNPTVVVTGDNRFVVAWEKVTPNGPEDQFKDIEIAVLNESGQITYGPTTITNSQALARDYSNPSLAYLSSNRVAVSFFMQPDAGLVQVGYALRQTSGAAIGSLSEIPGYSSSETGNLVAAPLASGNWLAAWVNTTGENVLYAVLDDSGGVINPPMPLVALDLRSPENIASTYDEFNHVILTWRDVASDYLYYTLIDANGAVLTPPMSFRRGLDPTDPNIFSTGTGGGLSPCPSLLLWSVHLPLMQRN